LPTIAAIYTSPVKSFSLEQPQSVTVGYSGIVEDRRFHLVDADGRLLTQRQEGRLALLKAQYSAETEVLAVQFPDGSALESTTELGDPTNTVLWGRQVPGREVTGPWSEAVSQFCGSPIRLVKTDSPGESYDEYPISLVSQASIDYLGARLENNRDFGSRRFRPNFLLEGCSPHEEDFWLGGVARIGPDLTLRLVGRDPRCAITTLDPDTGERDFDIPKLILSYRPSVRAAYFGIYGVVEASGVVSVGDQLELLQAPSC